MVIKERKALRINIDIIHYVIDVVVYNIYGINNSTNVVIKERKARLQEFRVLYSVPRPFLSCAKGRHRQSRDYPLTVWIVGNGVR